MKSCENIYFKNKVTHTRLRCCMYLIGQSRKKKNLFAHFEIFITYSYAGRVAARDHCKLNYQIVTIVHN